MFGFLGIIAVIIFVIQCSKKEITSDKKRNQAAREKEDWYIDSYGRSRLTETNKAGGIISKSYRFNGDEIKKLNDSMNFIEEGDELLKNFNDGREYKNYSREKRIALINKKINENKDKKRSVIPYPPDRTIEYTKPYDICKGYRYFDVKTHDFYVIRSFGSNNYFLRISDGKFIRPIDQTDTFSGPYYSPNPTQEQLNEIAKLNKEQDEIKKTYSGLEMYEKLYRNRNVGRKVRICYY